MNRIKSGFCIFDFLDLQFTRPRATIFKGTMNKIEIVNNRRRKCFWKTRKMAGVFFIANTILNFPFKFHLHNLLSIYQNMHLLNSNKIYVIDPQIKERILYIRVHLIYFIRAVRTRFFWIPTPFLSTSKIVLHSQNHKKMNETDK